MYTRIERCDGSFEHIPNFICAQQMCSKFEAVDYLSAYCEQCDKRTHEFWQDSVAKFIDYLRLSRPFAEKIYIISNNNRAYDAQFLLRRFLELKWVPQLIMDCTKNLSMSVENFYFLDSLQCMPMSLKRMLKSFDLKCKDGFYPHFYKTANNLDYVALIPNLNNMGLT